MVMAQAQPTKPFHLGLGPLSCHAWNKDRTQVAVSPNNNELHIYQLDRSNTGWERVHLLCEHDLPITGVDWAPNTNRLVTCSQDKNAFVWTFDGKTWNPELVLVRINRGATCVKWSPKENKFAVGSGSRLVSVCYYEKENDWWVAKHIKKPIRSTVNCIDWHPNNVLIAVGSCDFKTRVFSAYVKEVDEKPVPTPWGTKMPLGNLMNEISNGGGGWVHCVKFSPGGTRLAWVGHDSSVSVVDAENTDNCRFSEQSKSKVPRIGSISTVKDWYLPFTCLEWVSENSIVAAGHDCCPLLFSYSGPGQLKFVSKLDVPSELKSKENTQIVVHSGDRNRVTKFSTSGIDGILVLWDLNNGQKVNYCTEYNRRAMMQTFRLR